MRRRKPRGRQPLELLAAEVAWLSGVEQRGMNQFWIFTSSYAKVKRSRFLMERYAYLVPPRRRAKLEEDLRRWTPRSLR